MYKKEIEIVKETWLHRSFLKLKSYQLRHTLFAGGWSALFTRELVSRGSVAAVLPYDPHLDKVILIEQFRIGAAGHGTAATAWLVEVVAGIAEEGESMEALARREIEEEAGLQAISLQQIYQYWVSPGMCNEQVTLFYATVDASQAGGIYGLAEEHEDIKVHVVSPAEAFAWMDSGRINNAMSLIALQWLRWHLRSG